MLLEDSFRFCRTCYVTSDEYKTLTDSSELKLRSETSHQKECEVIYMIMLYVITIPKLME